MPDKFGPEEFAAAANVSRETLARLKIYAALLDDWNARHNLVSPASLVDVWRRHFFDSAQLVPFVPLQASSLIDLGSGAGFPGLVIAELLRERAMEIALVEATGKKCRFLETVAARLDLKVNVLCGRAELIEARAYHVVTSRALAPMDRLLGYAARFWGRDTVGLFLKGENLDQELTEARESWSIKLKRHPSRSDARGTIVEVRELVRAARS